MRSRNEIDEIILAGTLSALQADFPALAKRIQEALVEKPGENPIIRLPGQSVMKHYTHNLPGEEIKSILAALEKLAEQCGWNSKFAGVNLYRLKEVWKDR